MDDRNKKWQLIWAKEIRKAFTYKEVIKLDLAD